MPNYTHIKGVYIDTPCHENWDTMTETERGRFCNQCSMVVYDFTDATPEEFFKAYRENKGKICGLFSPQPLNFWQTQKNNLVHLLRQSKAAIIAIGMGLFAFKSSTAHILNPPQQTIVTDASDEFVQLSFEIRDSYTNELVKQDFKVTIIYLKYTAVINKVSDGVAVYQIPKECLNTKSYIIIEGEGIDKTSILLEKDEVKPIIQVAASKKAKRRNERRARKEAKRKAKLRAKYKRWRTMGAPRF